MTDSEIRQLISREVSQLKAQMGFLARSRGGDSGNGPKLTKYTYNTENIEELNEGFSSVTIMQSNASHDLVIHDCIAKIITPFARNDSEYESLTYTILSVDSIDNNNTISIGSFLYDGTKLTLVSTDIPQHGTSVGPMLANPFNSDIPADIKFIIGFNEEITKADLTAGEIEIYLLTSELN